MRNKRYRIRNKFRFSVFLILTSLFLISSFGTLFGLYTADSAQTPYKEICVQSGDTIWKLAQKHSKNNVEIREMIHHINLINDLDNSYIYPGQVLKIPIYFTDEI